jgi:ubiquinone/menaquinone biosynthesis C-methylase UbiE
MNPHDQIITTNQAWWEKMVAEGNGFTQPWLDLDPAIVQQYANGQLSKPPRPLDQVFPASILANMRGKDVLCMASGGGQQSAVFGLLEANVTVVDITAGQLAGDQQAARHYGYPVTTIQADMSDLSALADQSFDLVYQAPSMAYVPDVNKVYTGVARILRSGGLYRADAHNPLGQFIDEES